MRSSLIIFFITVIVVSQSYGQVKKSSQNLKEQAHKMGEAFVSGDFKTFANYTYPQILRSMGGAAKMIEILNRTSGDMKAKGMSFSSIRFDEPSKIVKSGDELQATITQHTEIKLLQGRLVSTSTLIAISTDNGAYWTFIDTSNKKIETLRKALPNLSSDISIPAQQPPVRYND